MRSLPLGKRSRRSHDSEWGSDWGKWGTQSKKTARTRIVTRGNRFRPKPARLVIVLRRLRLLAYVVGNATRRQFGQRKKPDDTHPD